jgi:hypothetical protein
MIDSILPALGLRPTLRIVYVAPLPQAPLIPSLPLTQPSGLPVYLAPLMSSTRPLPLAAVLIRSLQFLQTFGLPTVLP